MHGGYIYGASDSTGFSGGEISDGGYSSYGGYSDGGYSSTYGGYKDNSSLKMSSIEDYGNSVYSKNKEDLIRGIAQDICKVMRVTDFSQNELSQVVSQLSKLVPNPRKGKHIVKSEAAHKDISRSLAKIINERYKVDLIRMDASESEMIKQVSEIMYSLFDGLHTEFISIAGDVSKVISNLRALRTYVDATNKSLSNMVKENGSAAQSSRAENVDEVYSKVRNEIDRQLAILANMVSSVITPTTESMVSILEDSNEFKGLIQDLKITTGSEAFGDKLGYMLNGVSSLTHAAHLLDKALKQLKMPMEEFKKVKDMGDLRVKIYNHINEQKPSSEELRKMLEAANIIYNLDYDHDNILSVLQKKVHLEHDSKMSRYGGDQFDDMDRVNERDLHPGYLSRKSVERQVADQDSYKDRLFLDFKKILRSEFQTLVNATEHIAKKIGNEIPISEGLDNFVVRFGNIKSMDSDNIHMALCGYYKDPESKFKKTEFMSSMNAVLRAIESIEGSHQAFSEIKTAIGTIIKTVDDFSDNLLKSLTDMPVNISRNKHGDRPERTGGAPGMDQEYFVYFRKVQNDLKYYFNMANFKQNLEFSSKSLDSYSEDYENILGSQVAEMIDECIERFNLEIEGADYESINTAANDTNYRGDLRQRTKLTNGAAGSITALVNAGRRALTDPEKENLKGYRYVRTFQKNASVSLYKSAEALDMYLKNFTKSITGHPDDIKDLVAMLNQVVVVAKWFTSQTGEHLAGIMEAFGPYKSVDRQGAVIAAVAGNTVGNLAEGNTRSQFNNKSYFQWLQNTSTSTRAQVMAAANANNYYAEIQKSKNILGSSLKSHTTYTVDDIKTLYRKIDKSIRGNRALENIVSTFIRLGDKYNNNSLKSSSFMSAGQIYNALVNYMVSTTIDFGKQSNLINDLDLRDGYIKALNERLVPTILNVGQGYSLPADSQSGAVPLAAGNAPPAAFGANPEWDIMPIHEILGNLTDPYVYPAPCPLPAIQPNHTLSCIINIIDYIVSNTNSTYPVNGGAALDYTVLTYGGVPSVKDLFKNLSTALKKLKNLLKSINHGNKLDTDTVNNDLDELLDPQQNTSIICRYLTLYKYTRDNAAAAAFLGNFGNVFVTLTPLMTQFIQYFYSVNAVTAAATQAAAVIAMTAANHAGAPAAAQHIPADPRRVYLNTRLKQYIKNFPTYCSQATPNLTEYLALHLRRVEIEAVSEKNPPLIHFKETDEIFTNMIKAMVSKVLTVVGVFNLFNRPGTQNIKYSLAPLRRILGAAEETEIIDDAMELYVRLPLLGEWYRDKFGFNSATGVLPGIASSQDYIVSLVPGFDGIWSDFIRIIFVDTSFISSGTYSDALIQRLIIAINEIYKKFKQQSPNNVVRTVINAFVVEINKRYGFIKKSEIKKYFDSQEKQYSTQAYSADEERVDYDIIGEENDFARKAAPSDKFQTINPNARQYNLNKSIRSALKTALRNFNVQLDADITLYKNDINSQTSRPNNTNLQNPGFSFVDNLYNAKQSIINTKTYKEKFDVVRDAIQGINNVAGIGNEKLLMFHEVVVFPMTTLQGLINFLDNVRAFFHGVNLSMMDPNEDPVPPNIIAANAGHQLAAQPDLSAADVMLTNLKRLPKITDPNNVNRKQPPNKLKEQINNVFKIYYRHAGYNADADRTTAGQNARYCRYQILNHKLMRDVINALFSLGIDLNGMVEVRMSSGGIPIIDYSKLETMAFTMLGQIKASLKHLEGIIPYATIQKYELGTGILSSAAGAPPNTQVDSKNTYSIVNIEEALNDIFKNRHGVGMQTINESLASTWRYLTATWKYEARNNAAGAFTRANDNDHVGRITDGKSTESYERAIAELLYWNYNRDYTRVREPADKVRNYFPNTHLPIFKSGNFEATTPDEKAVEKAMENIDLELRTSTIDGSNFDKNIGQIVPLYTKIAQNINMSLAIPEINDISTGRIGNQLTNILNHLLDGGNQCGIALDAWRVLIGDIPQLDQNIQNMTEAFLAGEEVRLGGPPANNPYRGFRALNNDVRERIVRMCKSGVSLGAVLLDIEGEIVGLIARGNALTDVQTRTSIENLIDVTIVVGIGNPAQPANKTRIARALFNNASANVANNIPDSILLRSVAYTVILQTDILNYPRGPLAFNIQNPINNIARSPATDLANIRNSIIQLISTVNHLIDTSVLLSAAAGNPGSLEEVRVQSTLVKTAFDAYVAGNYTPVLYAAYITALNNADPFINIIYTDPQYLNTYSSMLATLQASPLIMPFANEISTALNQLMIVMKSIRTQDKFTKTAPSTEGQTQINTYRYCPDGFLVLYNNDVLLDGTSDRIVQTSSPLTTSAYYQSILADIVLRVNNGAPLVLAAGNLSVALLSGLIDNIKNANPKLITLQQIITYVTSAGVLGGGNANKARLLAHLIYNMTIRGLPDGPYTDNGQQLMGLIPVFNRTLCNYLYTFIEKSSGKIYLPLIESFINGPNSKEIMSGLGMDDFTLPATSSLSDPPPNTIMFASLANTIKAIYTRVNPKATGKYYLTTNFSEVPEYQKELMKANLPIFEKQFAYIRNKALFIKSIIEKGNMDLSRRDPKNETVAAADVAAAGINRYDTYLGTPMFVGSATSKITNKHNGWTEPKAESSTNIKKYDLGLINALVSGCNYMLKAAEMVQQELSDIPIYGETNSDSIKDFKNNYGKLPLTPLSSLSYLLRAGTTAFNRTSLAVYNDTFPGIATYALKLPLALCAKYQDWVPNGADPIYTYYQRYVEDKILTEEKLMLNKFTSGTEEFKMVYATRLLLAKSNVEPSMDYMIGVREIVNQYNANVGKDGKAPEYFDTIMINSVKLMRYLMDVRYHKRVSVADPTIINYVNNSGLNDTAYIQTANMGAAANGADAFIKNELVCAQEMNGFLGVAPPPVAFGVSALQDDYQPALNSVTEIFENSNPAESAKDIVTQMSAAAGRDNSRAKLRVYNIFDLNIVPINVHALQRELPLINIENYAGNFDSIMDETLPRLSGVAVPDTENRCTDIKDTRDALRLALKYPYRLLNKENIDSASGISISKLNFQSYEVYAKYFGRTLIGYTKDNLGRPKFNSDQLWGKVLLSNLYENITTAAGRAGQAPVAYRDDVEPLNNIFTRNRNGQQINYGNYNNIYTSNSEAPNKINKEFVAINTINTELIDDIPNGGSTIEGIVITTQSRFESMMRYNTLIIRNMEWFVNVQRYMRYLMRESLNWIDTPVIRESDTLHHSVTDFRGDQSQNPEEFTGRSLNF